LPLAGFAQTSLPADGERGIALERTSQDPGHLEKERAASETDKTIPNCVRNEPTISPEGEPSLHNLPLCSE
jgi:hypothetical protein